MTAPLEGAALFRAAAKVIDLSEYERTVLAIAFGWDLVPAMLACLQRRGFIEVRFHRNREVSAEIWVDDGRPLYARERDLPTALARLVLRVAELEGEA